MASSCFVKLAVSAVIFVLQGQSLIVNAQCEEYVHVNTTFSDPDNCSCYVMSSISSSCSSGVSREEYQQMIRHFEKQITNLTAQIEELQEMLQQQEDDLVEMRSEMSAIQATKQRIIESGIVISTPEYDIIRRDLQDMEELLVVLENQNVDPAVIAELRAEIANISSNLDSLQENNDADISSLLRDIDELEKKLAECERNKPTGPPGDDDFFPYPWEDIGRQDSCGKLVSISEPYTVTGNLGTQGTWMRDPIVDTDQVWHLPSYTSSATIYRYPSLDTFRKRGLYELYSLPGSRSFEGTGVVAYNGSLYFNQYTRDMYRYDYESTNSYTAQKQLPDAGYRSNFPYLYGGYTSIDFAVDEVGLWVIYGTSSTGGILTISKLSSETLEIENTWVTNVLKKSFGECFTVCGRLYCTDSYNKYDATVVFMYDTATGVASIVNIPFDSKYLLNTALQYNPRDQKLYAYNAGHALAYDLKFQ